VAAVPLFFHMYKGLHELDQGKDPLLKLFMQPNAG
jgi:hypothetical protein